MAVSALIIQPSRRVKKPLECEDLKIWRKYIRWKVAIRPELSISRIMSMARTRDFDVKEVKKKG